LAQPFPDGSPKAFGIRLAKNGEPLEANRLLVTADFQNTFSGFLSQKDSAPAGSQHSPGLGAMLGNYNPG
jgi:hypothetical protein